MTFFSVEGVVTMATLFTKDVTGTKLQEKPKGLKPVKLNQLRD
jgi:hypothetical protein